MRMFSNSPGVTLKKEQKHLDAKKMFLHHTAIKSKSKLCREAQPQNVSVLKDIKNQAVCLLASDACFLWVALKYLDYRVVQTKYLKN